MARKIIFLSTFLLCWFGAFAQFPDPVSWSVEVNPAEQEDQYDLIFTASIQAPWHIYDLGPYEDGPIPTSFEFETNDGYKRVGAIRQDPSPRKIHDEIFGMEIGYFADKVRFIQRVEVLSTENVPVQVTVEYQVCDDQSCLAPAEREFTVELKGSQKKKTEVAPVVTTDAPEDNAPGEEELLPEEALAGQVSPPAPAPVPLPGTESDPADDAELPLSKSLWSTIIEAILWGFAALLTPCVFPMVPMTVSFFMKGGEKKARGKFLGLLYGASIVLLYTLPVAAIILATWLAGGETVTADIFNWLSNHWLPNVVFFLVFLLFAASFFGAFDLRMPSKIVNKSASKADKGGIAGTFFMALTLVLVSFSCTGPIVGTVLIQSTQGAIWEPIVAMLAFSVAFALPFTLFALFPAFMDKMPRSGSWLQSVKIVLGFLELALGLKFLSIADQTYHWGILDREIYLALWIVIFTLLGFYLLGKLRFKHEKPVTEIGVVRLLLSVVTFSFVVYMVPGMWGAPLKGLSGYLPPLFTQDYVLKPESETGRGFRASDPGFRPKYSEFLTFEHGLTGFFDYDEAREYARRENKPLFVDFTGRSCVNCREMEMRVWSDPRVLKILDEEYVLLALYMDDKTRLPESEWIVTENGKTLRDLGKKNAYLASTKFGVNAQPYYVLLDHQERMLAPGRAYNLDVEAYLDFLRAGIENFKAGRSTGELPVR